MDTAHTSNVERAPTDTIPGSLKAPGKPQGRCNHPTHLSSAPASPTLPRRYHWTCTPASTPGRSCFTRPTARCLDTRAPTLSFAADSLSSSYDQFLVTLTVSSHGRNSSEAQVFLSTLPDSAHRYHLSCRPHGAHLGAVLGAPRCWGWEPQRNSLRMQDGVLPPTCCVDSGARGAPRALGSLPAASGRHQAAWPHMGGICQWSMRSWLCRAREHRAAVTTRQGPQHGGHTPPSP